MRSHLLVEAELLDNKVVIVEECLVDVVLDIVVQVWLYVERLVRLLNLLDPHIQGVELFIDEIFKVVGCIEYVIDTTHEEREEDEPYKLQNNREYILLACLPCIITVADSSNYFKYPIERKYVLCLLRLIREPIRFLSLVGPRGLATSIHLAT